MSADQPLSVNFVRMAETSSHIGRTIETMSKQLDDLERHAAPLVATWSGEARAAYDERQRTWRQASAELITTLAAIKRALDESMADYEATERQNVRLFTG